MLDAELGGLALERGVVPATVALIMPLEAQGYEESGDERITSLLPDFSPADALRYGADACKLLVPYRVDDDGSAGRQDAVVRSTARACHEVGLPLVVEPVVFRRSTESADEHAAAYEQLVIGAVARLQPLGADLFKLPFPVARLAAAVTSPRRVGGLPLAPRGLRRHAVGAPRGRRRHGDVPGPDPAGRHGRGIRLPCRARDLGPGPVARSRRGRAAGGRSLRGPTSSAVARSLSASRARSRAGARLTRAAGPVIPIVAGRVRPSRSRSPCSSRPAPAAWPGRRDGRRVDARRARHRLPVALVRRRSPLRRRGRSSSRPWPGAANVAGLLLAYTAYTIGAVGVVSTIASTEGAIAAVISVLAGQQLAPGSGPLLALIAVGVVLAATGGGQEMEEGVRISRERSLRAAGLAALSATMFGTNLFLTGSVSGDLPIAWLLLPGRALGMLVVGVPLLLAGRASIPRVALPFVVTCGIVEVTGTTAFAIGAQVDIAVTSVLASMFAPMAAVAAFVLFGERLARRQVAGIALVVAGIGLLGAAAGASRITG